MTNNTVLRAAYKKKISDVLEKFLSEKQKETTKINDFGNTIPQQLLQFTTSGKMIRGSLILFICETLTKKITDEALLAAASIELFHSSLLIHDDIMDNDELRRGQKTISAQFTDIGTKNNFLNSAHFGRSMGICVGDIGFFLGMEILTKITDEQKRNEIVVFFAKELQSVGFAQMQDVYNGYVSDGESEQEVVQVYRYKTARYTFSLPLMAGAILANQNKKTIDLLSKIGEHIGLLFQIKDDELGIFGDEKTIGKPIGSDIRENKKTLYRLYLYQSVSAKEKKQLDEIFGNDKLTSQQLQYVQKLIEELGVKKKIEQKTNKLQTDITKDLKSLNLPINANKKFLTFLHYIIERKN